MFDIESPEAHALIMEAERRIDPEDGKVGINDFCSLAANVEGCRLWESFVQPLCQDRAKDVQSKGSLQLDQGSNI